MGHSILLGIPLGGYCSPNAVWAACESAYSASRKHPVRIITSAGSGANFNALWIQGLNAAVRMECTHFAMLHADIDVIDRVPWADLLIEEMEARDLAYISNTSPIKDGKGVLSCGLAEPGKTYEVYKRFTAREAIKLPETFTAAEIGHPDKLLLHNNGMWVADLRKPCWYPPYNHGKVPVYFEFHENVIMAEGTALHAMLSEDWGWSHKLHAAGAMSAITQKVKMMHVGEFPFPNFMEWGTYAENGDEMTAPSWRNKHG